MVVVNGEVAAVTRPGTGTSSFYAMIPPSLVREGSNDISIHLVEEGASGAVLRPLQ